MDRVFAVVVFLGVLLMGCPSNTNTCHQTGRSKTAQVSYMIKVGDMSVSVPSSETLHEYVCTDGSRSWR